MHLLAHRLAVRELPGAGLALARVHCSHLANGLRCLPSISVEAENRAIIRLSLLQQGELGFSTTVVDKCATLNPLCGLILRHE